MKVTMLLPRNRSSAPPYPLELVPSEDPHDIVQLLQKLCDHFYWLCFRNGLASKCHPFLEFNGVMQQYVSMCRSAADNGIDFAHCSVHQNRSLPMRVADASYLADKLNCIFGAAIRSNPEVARIFREKLGL